MNQATKELSIVFTGHVDHGKSTIIGQLLQQLGYVREERITQLKDFCERNQKPFELAFLLDAFSDEREQNVTIDACRVRVKVGSSFVTLIDAPGHRDFVRNMITGATRADAAFLVIDASEGIRENTRRHAHLLSLLGFRDVAVLVNKMDLIEYSSQAYRRLTEELQLFFKQINLRMIASMPVSGRSGDGISKLDDNLSWFDGKPLVQLLQDLKPKNSPELDNDALRLPVQDIYRPADGPGIHNGKRRILGSILSGRLKRGDPLLLLPSGRKTRTVAVENFPTGEMDTASAGSAVAVVIEDDLYINRGELICSADNSPPSVSERFKANVIWFGEGSLARGAELVLQLGTSTVPVRLEQIIETQDLSDLSLQADAVEIKQNEVATCELHLERPIAADIMASGRVQTARFVLSKNGRISGAGSILETLSSAWNDNHLVRRHLKWEPGLISARVRGRRFGQAPALVLIHGEAHAPRKELAKLVEAELFASGRATYFLTLGGIVYGLDADLPKDEGLPVEGREREEHMRRLGEVTRMLLDAGLIVVVSSRELFESDFEILRLVVDPSSTVAVWYGSKPAVVRSADLELSLETEPSDGVSRVARLLEERGVILRA